jgi:NTE family protein
MKRALVLGGGGLVGMGYHAGALKALEEWGVDVSGFELIVGTSAGAVMGAYLRCGWSPGDFYDYAHGRHPESLSDPDDQAQEVRELFIPLWSTPIDRVRRGLGSLFAVASSRGYWRAGAKGKIPRAALRRAFPAGLYSTDGTRARLSADLPERWPEKDLYLCAADLYTGERIAFGSRVAPEASLPAAVLASTAIPGVFPPVKIGDRHYVDGGVVTATSLDLASDFGCDVIVCIAPLGYKRRGDEPLIDLRSWTPVLVRAPFARALAREVNKARGRGSRVLVIRPWLHDLAMYGTNAMRHYDRAAMTEAAREGTLRLLAENKDHPALKRLEEEVRR